MTTQAQCTFSVQGWDEQTFTEGEDALKLTHTSVTKHFQGDLEGDGRLWYLMFYGPNQQTRVVGLERVTGKLGSKSGSFVLEHGGADDGEAARETVTILPGSGTGELQGIRGSGQTLADRQGQMRMTLDYDLG